MLFIVPHGRSFFPNIRHYGYVSFLENMREYEKERKYRGNVETKKKWTKVKKKN